MTYIPGLYRVELGCENTDCSFDGTVVADVNNNEATMICPDCGLEAYRDLSE